MKRVLFIFLLLFLSILQTLATIKRRNLMLEEGPVVSMDMSNGIIPKGHRLVDKSDILLEHLDSMWNKTKDVNYLSDYGTVLIFQGSYTEAKNIFLKIESIKPNQYITASSLGLIYELLGDNTNALKWINRSVVINAALHDSTEWLHLRILEAKIKGDDTFISPYFLLHTGFGTDSMPVSHLPKKKLLELREAVFYQLNERVTFIHTEDKVIAQLLFDLANISLLTGANIYDVNDLYSMAKKYGYSDPLWEKRSIYTKHLSLKINKGQGTVSQKDGEITPSAETSVAAMITIGISLLIFPVLAFLFLKKRLESNKVYKRYL